jgi:hypothetical protein
MRGVFLVAAELANRGFTVSLTSRSAKGADLLVTDQSCNQAFSVEVKTNGKRANFWLLSKGAESIVSPSHVYVLVNLNEDLNAIEYYVIPSALVAKRMKVQRNRNSTWYSIALDDAVRKQLGQWGLFDARGSGTTQPHA